MIEVERDTKIIHFESPLGLIHSLRVASKVQMKWKELIPILMWKCNAKYFDHIAYFHNSFSFFVIDFRLDWNFVLYTRVDLIWEFSYNSLSLKNTIINRSRFKFKFHVKKRKSSITVQIIIKCEYPLKVSLKRWNLFILIVYFR